MSNIFEDALDKLAEGALDSECHNMCMAWNKANYLAAKDIPAATVGLKLLVGVLFAMMASGQAGPE